jgi:hypothetical protein
MPIDALTHFNLLVDEFNQLVDKYKEILPKVHLNLTGEKLEEMAEDSAYMQMHIEGKI